MAVEPDLFDELEARSLQVRPGPRIGPPERLSATMALSTIAFGVLILGVGFTLDDPAPVMPTLDVILIRTSTAEPPKEADFLAQFRRDRVDRIGESVAQRHLTRETA